LGTTKSVGEEIAQIEGFDVRFVASDGADPSRRKVDPYPYSRAARNAWTVAQWRRERFDVVYPNYGVEVLGPDGEPVHGKVLLENLRARYYEFDADETAEPEDVGHPRPSDNHQRRTSAEGRSAPPDDDVATSPGPRRTASAGKVAKQAKTLEATLWEAADKMRGNLEAGEYKHVVLGLVFLKYVSDAFADRRSFL